MHDNATLNQQSKNIADKNTPQSYDGILQTIADYVLDEVVFSSQAYHTAQLCLLDTLGCGILALNFPAACNLLGPIMPGTHVPKGIPVIGTDFKLDPILATFNMGLLNRWLDFNDTWLAAEWGHPSDNIAGILAVSMYKIQQDDKMLHQITMHDIFTAMIKAYEIQGVLALNNSFNQVGLDHVLLVKCATCAVVAQLLGANREQLLAALSQCWLDGHSLRTYRHAPNAGSRKSWAAGDAAARGVSLAMWSLKGEMGYPTALSTPRWGFESVCFKGNKVTISQPLSDYVMENILFKVNYPAEFHAQTAVEAAVQLHPKIKNRVKDIASIVIETQQAAIDIISKVGTLNNPADRDHCLQYMIAVALLEGDLRAEHYEDNYIRLNDIEGLREKMIVNHNPSYTEGYFDPTRRSIANSVKIIFKDGEVLEKVEVKYPLGHQRRRKESEEALIKKFNYNIQAKFNSTSAIELEKLWTLPKLQSMPLVEFLHYWGVNLI